MVEPGTRAEKEVGGKEVAMASSSAVNQYPLPTKDTPTRYFLYPSPLAKYEEIVANPNIFRTTLEKLHASMKTKFKVPIIGGKELDIHRLFVEVTSRGGIEKVVRERRWREVTATFNFPSSATNASFVLRKYYYSLLHHFEQLYYFKVKGWSPLSSDAVQNTYKTPVSVQGSSGPLLLPAEVSATPTQQQGTRSADVMLRESTTSTGTQVTGVIDGKFESGYLITVTIGSKKLKGVLYQASENPEHQVQQNSISPQEYNILSSPPGNNPAAASGSQRRRRRKKSEIRRRDPAHPKPNRSSYNFFFADQHARLKPLHPGKDREISRMIGELWTTLQESEKSVYQEKAVKDKERYKLEMEVYRERLRTGQVISDAIPIQQIIPGQDVSMEEADGKLEETEGMEFPHTLENEISSCETDSEDDKTTEKESDLEATEGAEVVADRVNMESLAEEVGSDLGKNAENVVSDVKESLGNVLNQEATEKEPAPSKEC